MSHYTAKKFKKNNTGPNLFTAVMEIISDFLPVLVGIFGNRTLFNINYGSGKSIPNLGDKLIYDEFALKFKLIGQK